LKKTEPLTKRLSKKPLLLISSLLLFTTAVIVLIYCAGKPAPQSMPPDLSFFHTPSPEPLQSRVYTTSPRVITVIYQIFNRREAIPNPSQIMDQHKLEAVNEYFELYSYDDYLPVDIQWLKSESSQVYEYVSKRLGTAVSEKVIILFLPPRSGKNPARGTSFHELPPVIMIFADQDTGEEQILAVLAHELGHILIHQKYQDIIDLALDEGLATWAAGNYWQDWQGTDFDSAVRAFIQNGTYLPLFDNYYIEKAYESSSPDCILHRDILLTEMASFLNFLIQNYGIESVSSIVDTRQPEFEDGQRIIFPPNYFDVYGLEFNQLEYQWLETLFQPG